MSDLTLHIQRYLPGTHTAPELQTYTLPVPPDASLLDALRHVQDHLDPSLAMRWSCRMGICGSCGVRVDGQPKLACEVFVRDLGHEATIEPLDHLPIQRDLIVDMSGFLEHLSAVRPWIHGDPGEAPRQSPAQLTAYKAASGCINCLLCVSACPQAGLSDAFLGPAAISLGHRYNQDSRDSGNAERLPALQSKHGAWGCTLVGVCSEVCPKGVDPAAAIQQEKVRGAITWVGDAIRRLVGT